MMSYGWFVKLRTFVSTNTKCTCVPTHGTEVSVSACELVANRGALLVQAWVSGGKEWGVGGCGSGIP